jgi:hypothetical protein
MRRIRILLEAAEELEEAVARYELQREGLGAEFARVVEAALDVLEAPTAPLVAMQGRGGERGSKRVMLRRFPFGVVVRDSPQEIVVVAFAHQARRPGFWRNRG